MPLRPAIVHVAVAAVFAAIASACSADPAVVVTLVSRQHRDSTNTCEGFDPDYYFCMTFPPTTMRDEHGALVTIGELHTKNFPGPYILDAIDCGGETFAAVSADSSQNRIETEDGELVQFEDGASVRLIPESATYIAQECYDVMGRWDGIDGPYAGRTGTYRWIDDTLQVELILTES